MLTFSLYLLVLIYFFQSLNIYPTNRTEVSCLQPTKLAQLWYAMRHRRRPIILIFFLFHWQGVSSTQRAYYLGLIQCRIESREDVSHVNTVLTFISWGSIVIYHTYARNMKCFLTPCKRLQRAHLVIFYIEKISGVNFPNRFNLNVFRPRINCYLSEISRSGSPPTHLDVLDKT